MWSRSSPVDGFRLAFDRFGTRGAPAVVLLHGWPGNRHDYRRVVPILGEVADIIVPDLRGFGGSDKHEVAVRHFYSATAQAGSIVGLIKELGLSDVVIAGYDVGSRVAQSVARMHPELVQALVLSPPLPGAGERVLTAQAQGEFWYQAFHQLPLAARADRRKSRRRPRILAALLDSLVRPEFHALRGRSGPTGVRLRAAWRLHRIDRVVPRRRRHDRPVTRPNCRPTAPSRSTLPPMCCGRSMIRCSRASGPIGWSTTSPMCGCISPTAPGISPRWSAPSSSRSSSWFNSRRSSPTRSRRAHRSTSPCTSNSYRVPWRAWWRSPRRG